MRQVILDTETTGFDPAEGHRMIEIGCVELYNHLPTGQVFHCYLNPQRDVPPDAVRVHGLTTAFLADKPLFTEKVEDFLAFLKDSPLVIHNAEFDMKFINAELAAAGFPALTMNRVIDTVLLARQKCPGQPASLDALCRRFKIDLSGRTLHGALLDARLLADVYLELVGGRQHGLGLMSAAATPTGQQVAAAFPKQKRPYRSFAPSAEEITAHRAFVGSIKNALWNQVDTAKDKA